MNKSEYRAVIKFLTLEGCEYKNIHERLVAVYGESAPSLSTVSHWTREIKRGRQSLEDEERSGRPSTSINADMTSKVEALILENRRITIEEISNTLKISTGSVHTVIHQGLNMNKVNTKWVPRILTLDMRQTRIKCSREMLDLSTDLSFFDRIVTGDESWVHYYDPETPREAREWKHPGSPTPRRSRLNRSAGKILMSVFWDVRGIILVDFLTRGQMINGAYYSNLMSQLREAIKTKRRGMLTRGVLLLHDNAPIHKSVIAQTEIKRCGYVELNHPPYSPDIAPSDFFLFPALKKHLRGQRFEDDETLITAVNDFFQSQTSNFYRTGIYGLKDKWSRVINSNGSYFE